MHKKLLFLSFAHIICWVNLFYLAKTEPLSIINTLKIAQAQPQPPDPFLGAVYYGQKAINNVFDHQYPFFSPKDDGNNFVAHYDGNFLGDDEPIPAGYGYDQHVGVDYYMEYQPVLAAASGNVAVADWSDKENHRLLYGLHVQMDHDANSNYRVWYGHLSMLAVQQGDEINLDNNLDNSHERILGISGNTGSVRGDCPSVSENPLCSPHLHLEVRTGGRPVDPYGWVGNLQDPPVADPWATHPEGSGAVSYPLWQNRPATQSTQYNASGGNGPALAPPDIDLSTAIEIDDISQSSSDSPCWSIHSDPTAIHGTYFRTTTITNTVEACQVQWTIPKLTNADDFDIYVHIPDPATALNATYTIHHANQESTAIVVQAAYPNEEHDAWAYIGRYNFLADETIPEYVVLSNETTDDDFGSIVVADAIRLIPTNPNTVPGFTHNDTATTTENTPVTIDVLANDEGTGLNIVAVTQADYGAVTINNDGPSSPADISGIDTVTYTLQPATAVHSIVSQPEPTEYYLWVIRKLNKLLCSCLPIA